MSKKSIRLAFELAEIGLEAKHPIAHAFFRAVFESGLSRDEAPEVQIETEAETENENEEWHGVEWQDVGEAFDFSRIRMTLICRTDREITEEEIRRASGCLGYALREVLHGENLSEPTVIEANPLGVVRLGYYYDSTKAWSDDPDIGAAFAKAKQYVIEGTPIRKKDGQRRVEGIGEEFRGQIYFKVA